MKKDDYMKKIKELEAIISDLRKENEAHKALIFLQQEKLNELLKDKEKIQNKLRIKEVLPFIPKTEKTNVIINEPEEVLKEEKELKKRGRKSNGNNFSKVCLESSVTEIRYEDPKDLKCNICNNDLTLASTKERYIVEVIPQTIKVVKVIKRSYKCKKDNSFYYPISNNPFPGSILTPSFAAYIAYHKYELGIPFNHLEKHLTNVLNIPISKQLMSEWMKKLALKLNPLFNKLKDDLLNNTTKVIHSDETTLVVSKKPLYDIDRKKSYVYVYTSSYFDRQIQIYDFNESRSINKTASWLKDYNGYIVCDDYSGYNKLKKDNHNIKLQKCFAHVRRKFTDIIKTLPNDKVKKTTSYKIVSLINKLFEYEAHYKENMLLSLGTDEFLRIRRENQLPIIEELKTLVFDTPISPNSPIESAIKYARANFDDLLTYLDYPYLEISNNIAERAVKPFVINRKVFMTSGSYAGAKYTTVIFSIIRTAIINHLDIQKYLIYVIENIGTLELDDLVPYSVNIPDYIRI